MKIKFKLMPKNINEGFHKTMLPYEVTQSLKQNYHLYRQVHNYSCTIATEALPQPFQGLSF